MPTRRDIWKFPNSITKFINKQWSKLKTSSDGSNSLKSSGILDQLLQEEYASLIQEINAFDTEKRCFLCFKNEKFSVQSSKDLTKILEKHSEEVLKHYVATHVPNLKGNGCARTGSDLVNYVTKVVVSRPKCNRQNCYYPVDVLPIQEPPKEEDAKKCDDTICDCKRLSTLKPPQKITNKASVESKNSTKIQKPVSTETTAPTPVETQTSDIPITKMEQLDTEAQTDPWEHDPDCTCGCCPKTEPEVNEMNVATEAQNLQDTSTSHAVLTDSKSVSMERKGESIEVQTSINKICISDCLQSLLKANIMISTGPNKADCGCDVYDSKEQIGAQKQNMKDKVIEVDVKPTKTEESFQSHNVNDIPVTTIKKDPVTLAKTPYVYEYEITPTAKVKKEKQKKKSTGCFGSKKKNKGCSEECQGINNKPRSMQTEKVKTLDKNEEAHVHTDKRTNQTSTDSEAAIQVTDLTSSVHHARKHVKEDYHNIHMGEEDERKKHKTVYCEKCGRQKKTCDTGCRNMIIIPHVSKSDQASLNQETESLRKLIKMQHEDTNRQFDNIMAKLTRHSSEITRLNNVYQNLARQGLDDIHSEKKKESQLSHYKCGCSLKFDQLRSCGCKYSNECRTNTSQSTSRIVNFQNGSVMDNKRSKRFGPPNTAIGVNMCNLRTSQLVSNPVQQYQHLEEKQRKEFLNQSKRTGINKVQTGPLIDNDPRARGDPCQFQISSVSTIYQNENQYNQRESVENRSTCPKHDCNIPKTDSGDLSLKKEPKCNKSKVQVWLKKSWITVKQKNDQERKNTPVAGMFNLCQNAAKKMVTGAWKYMKKT